MYPYIYNSQFPYIFSSVEKFPLVLATPFRGNIFHASCRLGVTMWPLNFAAIATLSFSSSLKRHPFRLNPFFFFILSLGRPAAVIEIPNVQVVEYSLITVLTFLGRFWCGLICLLYYRDCYFSRIVLVYVGGFSWSFLFGFYYTVVCLVYCGTSFSWVFLYFGTSSFFLYSSYLISPDVSCEFSGAYISRVFT